MNFMLLLRVHRQNMEVVNLKYKYLIACICLLAAFWCGYNLRQWYIVNHRVVKHISLFYSFSKDDVRNSKFEEFVRNEFKKQGIEPVFERFYLDYDSFAQKSGIDHTVTHLDILMNKPLDLIIPVGDNATYSLLSTGHRLLSSVPVVACNVHFPDEDLINKYESKKVYVLRDTPDFERNLQFIKSLKPDVSMEVIYNIDLTPLGHKSFELFTRNVNRRNVRILSPQSAFPVEDEYVEIKKMSEYFSLLPALANENSKKNELTVSLCPFRYIKGSALLLMMKNTRNKQGERAFLLDKSDHVALPIVNALNMPSFSCVREGFGEETKIVGGYMATNTITAKAVADLAIRLMNKEKIGMPKIRDLEKEYILDWKYFSAYSGYDIDNVSNNVRVINYPFYDHYRQELYFLGGFFILAFIFVSIVLLRTHRRSQIEHQNLKMLEEAHKRLTLSADGGQISLWNMHDNIIEFDDNFATLTGLRQREFDRTRFRQFIHPEDMQLLNSFTEELHKSPCLKVQRLRFSFGEEEYQWYELRCRSLKDAKGGIILAGIMQNIHEMVEREHQLVLAKQMAERAELKQSFLNNMSHEIRTPLNAIVGFTNLLLSEDAADLPPEEKADMLGLINHNNELLLKLINDVLEISRLDSGTMDFEIKRWNMVDVVSDIYKTYQSIIQSSLEFCLELDDAVPLLVDMDCLRFTQVISNFLSNANKFTSSGRITLGCKADMSRNEVCVYVKDTGKGIDKKELMMIFDRFYKTDEFGQGSGLGLPICKVIIEKLEGRIEVESKVGVGSCFSVCLALAEIK